MAPAPIWLWGPESDLFSPLPGPWAAQPQLHALSVQPQGTACPFLAPWLAQVGTSSRGAGAEVSPPWHLAGPAATAPASQSSGNMRWLHTHPQPWTGLYKCWVYPAGRYSSDTTMPMLWYWQAPNGIPFIAPRPFATIGLLLAWAALWEGCWDR